MLRRSFLKLLVAAIAVPVIGWPVKQVAKAVFRIVPINSRDAEFLVSRQFTMDDIERWFCLPPGILDQRHETLEPVSNKSFATGTIGEQGGR